MNTDDILQIEKTASKSKTITAFSGTLFFKQQRKILGY